MAGNKYYIVWKGLNPGVYNNREAYNKQVAGQQIFHMKEWGKNTGRFQVVNKERGWYGTLY